MIIDIHSHLNFPEFDSDREKVILDMQSNNVATITVGTSLETSKSAVELADKYPFIASTIGIHPTEKEDFNQDVFTSLINTNVVAVGECGLDYFRGKESETFQRLNFEKQIDFAQKSRLPIMVHSRPTKGTSDAYFDIVDMLVSTASSWPSDIPRGNMHFFSGNLDSARLLLNQGMTLSFDGPITFTSDYDDVIEFTPLDSIHVETDAPFAAPVPYRGKRSDPTMVEFVIERISQIKRIDKEDLKKQLLINAFSTFPQLKNALR